MNQNQTRARILFGWMTAAAAVVALVITLRENHLFVAGKTTQKPEISMINPERTAINTPRERKLRIKSDVGHAASQRLLDSFAAGELGSIQDELANLAENRQLADVSDVLKTWCRQGSLEVAQWAIVYSQESDPDLSLELCAEALSNPSEVIRELAAAQLEVASEIRFTYPEEARAWLAARPKSKP